MLSAGEITLWAAKEELMAVQFDLSSGVHSESAKDMAYLYWSFSPLKFEGCFGLSIWDSVCVDSTLIHPIVMIFQKHKQ